jgi:adenylosuccinate lyase
MGFAASFPVTGQTYTRKVDSQVFDVLAGIGQSAHKFGNDLRLLHNLKEVEEPFEAEQIGSSAMAYKRNPMRSERMCSLARFVISTAANPAFTAATQWLERTLDDSANRRITLAEAFLATDSLLNVALNVAGGLVVYPKMIERHVADEMPFMATEEILMAAVKAGGDRQALHERIRKHSMAATRRVRAEGKPNDLLKRIAADPAFDRIKRHLPRILEPSKFVGRAPQQVDEFLAEVVSPILKRHGKLLGLKAELAV